MSDTKHADRVKIIARALCAAAGRNPDASEHFGQPVWTHYEQTAETLLSRLFTTPHIAAPAELKADMTKVLPGGKLDDSTYSQIEDALDKIEAPMKDGTRWLTLPERIAAIGEEVRSLEVSNRIRGENVAILKADPADAERERLAKHMEWVATLGALEHYAEEHCRIAAILRTPAPGQERRK